MHAWGHLRNCYFLLLSYFFGVCPCRFCWETQVPTFLYLSSVKGVNSNVGW
ncbi:hypothetical protein MANES_16G026751v8 [Manihot esculenta]|uniref:Uncharacterized protein n=1 Tax=Manihot esculenta TaxID=3983 RepID=A0ACB7G585_MANES|nr:hypothetical protein MANES_16G026751v8 [Manihot esculenta]